MILDPWENKTPQQITEILTSWLKNPQYGRHTKYGYEIYLPSLAFIHLTQNHQISDQTSQVSIFKKHSGKFYSSAWELCRRGILRPGLTSYQEQSTDDGASGNGYSITDYGRTWLQETNHEDFIPTEPETFGKMIARYNIFGPGFHQRSQEAIRCYGAHAYLACCAMSGAASESIVLNLAIQKNGDEEKILKLYTNRDGRKKIEQLLMTGQSQFINDNILTFCSLLKYCRDEAAHGSNSSINEEVAFHSLAVLLRMARFCSEHQATICKK